MQNNHSIKHHLSINYRFELARSPQDIRDYFTLRTAIFCDEQQLFVGNDKDDIDATAYPIIALTHPTPPAFQNPKSKIQNSPTPSPSQEGDRTRQNPKSKIQNPKSKIVGVVRIYEPQPRLWYGGRLGVHADYRRVGRIGKGLIYKAVTTANTWGCDRFLATVQLQNVRFFRRLHWQSIDQIMVCDRPHHLMEADLSFYPPGTEIRPVIGDGDRQVS